MGGDARRLGRNRGPGGKWQPTAGFMVLPYTFISFNSFCFCFYATLIVFVLNWLSGLSTCNYGVINIAHHEGGAEAGGRDTTRAGAEERPVQAADRRRPGLPASVAQLLRAGPAHRVAGHARPPVRPDLGRPRRMRTHVLRSRLQRPPAARGRTLQLQISLVLLRQVSEVPPSRRGIRLPMNCRQLLIHDFFGDGYSHDSTSVERQFDRATTVAGPTTTPYLKSTECRLV